MSFGGHVSDMIRRDNENRKLRKDIKARKFNKKNGVLKSNYEKRRDIPLSGITEKNDFLRRKLEDDNITSGLILLIFGALAFLILLFVLFVL